MGNPAAERRKKSEKRRAKHENRLGGPLLAYVAKDVRETVLKAIAAEGEAVAEAKK